MPAIAIERPAGYLVAREFTTCGRRMRGGEPVPDQAATPLLVGLGWIRPVDELELETAIATYGRPPEELRVGWVMERDLEVSRKRIARRRKQAKKRKKARS